MPKVGQVKSEFTPIETKNSLGEKRVFKNHYFRIYDGKNWSAPIYGRHRLEEKRKEILESHEHLQ